MARHRPAVFILTDGSGGRAGGATQISADCVRQAGGRLGGVFCVAPDRAWYAALLAADETPFAAALAAILAAARPAPRLVVSDAVDGYNPLHDLCAALAAAVVVRLRRDGARVRHLVSPAVPVPLGPATLRLRLTPAELRRKHRAIRDYRPLAGEIRALGPLGPRIGRNACTSRASAGRSA